MSNEEFEKRFEKKIEFILDQQTQFASDIQQLRETQATNDNHLARLAAITTDGFKELIEKVSSVIDAQIRTEENVSSLAETVSALTKRMDELAEAQAHTDQRLNVIIDIIGEDRNGRSRS